MNNEEIEQGVVNYLATQLPEGTVLRKGTEIQERPVGQKLVIVAVRDVPRDVGKLYTGTLTVLVQTPYIMDGSEARHTPADHGAIVNAVEYAMNPVVDEDHDEAAVAAMHAALSAAIQAAANCRCGGAYSEGPRTVSDKDQWITTFDVLLGLERL